MQSKIETKTNTNCTFIDETFICWFVHPNKSECMFIEFNYMYLFLTVC